MWLIRKLYASLLNLYPKTYQEEYGDELQSVFNLSLVDAIEAGRLEVARVTLHELISLPKAILYEHLRERRKAKMIKKFSSRFDFAFGSFLEFFSALYPFLLLGGVMPLMNVLMRLEILASQSMLVNGIAIVLLAILGILCLIGLAKGLPRWSLTYLGFLISIFSVYQFPAWLDRWWIRSFPSLYDRSWFLGQVAYQGILWVGLSVVALLLVLLIAFFPFLRRFKKDWTLLLLLLYGSSPFALILTFDDYMNEEPYALLAFLVLAVGLWLYLHTQNPRRQFWALFGGLTISLFIAAIAKAIIYQYFWDGIRHFTWWTEMMSTVIMWMWIALGMLIPLLLKLFPQSKDRLQAT